MPDEHDRLPPAHPAFSAHFTHPLYSPDNYENDDLPPFGSDEGFDAVHEWAERLDDLRTNPNLRHMLGEGAEQQIEQLRRTDQSDVDDIVLGLGFTLLRFTGQIDPEGRGWLSEALARQDARLPGSEYAILLADLHRFTHTQDPLARLASRPIRRLRPWVSITGVNDDKLHAWFKRVAKAVASDPTWRDWWAGTPLDYLVIYPSPMGPPGRDHTSFYAHPSRLEVIGSSAALAQISGALLKAEESGRPVPADPFCTPEVRRLFAQLILRLLKETGDHLGLPRAPDELPG